MVVVYVVKWFLHEKCPISYGKVAHKLRRPTQPQLILDSVAGSNWEYCYSPLGGILVHRRVTPSSMSPVPIYTPGWRETMWGKVSCLRKQHDGRDWASNHRLSDLKFNLLTTTPPSPTLLIMNSIIVQIFAQKHRFLQRQYTHTSSVLPDPPPLTVSFGISTYC